MTEFLRQIQDVVVHQASTKDFAVASHFQPV